MTTRRRLPFPRRMMDDELTVVRVPFVRDDTGVAVDGDPVRTVMRCATAPGMLADDKLSRELTESGIRIEGSRVFWTADPVRLPGEQSHADLIEYGGEAWRVHTVMPWGPLWETVAVRQEPQ